MSIQIFTITELIKESKIKSLSKQAFLNIAGTISNRTEYEGEIGNVGLERIHKLLNVMRTATIIGAEKWFWYVLNLCFVC